MKIYVGSNIALTLRIMLFIIPLETLQDLKAEWIYEFYNLYMAKEMTFFDKIINSIFR